MSLAGHTPFYNAPHTMEAAADVACMRRFVYEALVSGAMKVALSGVGGKVDGVGRYNGTTIMAVPVDMAGILPVESGAAVAVGDEVVPDSVGRCVPGVGYGTDGLRGVGRARQAAAGSGSPIEILFYGPGQIGHAATMAPERIITDAQTLSVVAEVTNMLSNGAWTATLPAGRYIGQNKYVRLDTDTSGAITVSYTGSNAGVATTAFVLTAVQDRIHLQWNGTAWVTVSFTGTTFV
jgi:hypothetical protein